jgi:DNA polymerase (family 10)
MSQGKQVANSQARSYVEPITEFLKAHPGVQHVALAGSIRRGKPRVKDADITFTLTGNATIYRIWDESQRVLGLKFTRGGDFEKTTKVGVLQVELRAFAPKEYGAALLFTTGSGKFNVAMRTLAKVRGLLLNRYGLWTRDKSKLIASTSEQAIFDALGLPFVPVEERGDPNMVWRVVRRFS